VTISNDEARMSNEARSANDDEAVSRCSSFGHSSFLGASSFGIRHFPFSGTELKKTGIIDRSVEALLLSAESHLRLPDPKV
jgi:hypothetical protein